MLEGPITTQEARRAGFTRRQLRSKRWRTPFRGVHEASDSPQSLLSQCRALARVLPEGAVFSGITVARLRGWWLPRDADCLPIHVTVPPACVVERKGVRATRRQLEPHEITEFEGLRLTSGLRTLKDLAADWSLIDLVVLADAALHFGDCSDADWQAAGKSRGGRGIRNLRRATTLTDERSESAMETLLRLLVVLSGLPPPKPQVILLDDAGGWLARVDLLAPDGVTVLEYDGASHDAPKRHNADVRRWCLLQRHGFKVFPYTARDLFRGAAQVVADYQDALGLPRDPSAVEGWLREFRRSSFGRPPT